MDSYSNSSSILIQENEAPANIEFSVESTEISRDDPFTPTGNDKICKRYTAYKAWSVRSTISN